MNRDIVEGSWKQFKGNVQERWSLLIGDHLGAISGRRAQMAGERQRAYGLVCSRSLRGDHGVRRPAQQVPSTLKAGGVPPPMA